MSRSRLRNPAGGITTAPSDKPWKALEHRAAWREARHHRRRRTPHPKKHSDLWASPKDGKAWYGWGRSDLLRK